MRIKEVRTNSSLKKKKNKLFSIEIVPELTDQKPLACFDGSPDQLITNVNPFSHPHPLRQLGGLHECFVLG